ncbi:hypothetical protein OA331_02025 [Bacteroidota bacterium]|nr:hypothetical protein [Bacteroidota bacterium]
MEKKNIIVHRVNTIKSLKSVDTDLGCEIDIRTDGSQLILNHDPFKKGDNFIDYLDEYQHGTLVLNIKETGIENDVLDEVKKRKIKSYFLLDVEFPYIIRAFMRNENNIAIRFSEYETIENVITFKNNLKWVWVDLVSKIPINDFNFKILNQFNLCLVCPSLWNRSNEIFKVKDEIEKYNFKNISVITESKYIFHWINKENDI